MRRLIVLCCVLLWLPAGGTAEAARVLRAKHLPTGKWLLRVDQHPAKSLAAFGAEVAAQYGLPESEIQVVETDWTLAERIQAEQEQLAGTHEGLAVTAPTLPVLENPEALRRSLGGIFAGTAAQKRERWGAVLEKYPAVSVVLTLLRPPMTPDAKATVTEIVTRLCKRVGTGTEVLTATEYDALKTLATEKGLGALVPPRPCP